MKILIYCQHVLGIGHLYRTLEITKAMNEHQITLVLGGPPASISLPDHINVVQLPGLQMDANFSALFPVDAERTLEEVQKERKEVLYKLALELQPDVIMIELFPFGRNAFSFELLPLLEATRNGALAPAKVVCSLRDILVEKKHQEKFEQRAVDRLNSFFDALLIHGDPDVITLDETFSKIDEISIPVVYTGYICEKSESEESLAIREKIRIQPDEQLILVSAGGGNVGYHLLETALKSYDLLEFPVRMQVFTGPYLPADKYDELKRKATPGCRVERFSSNFPAWLGAADLSISMGGYNTTMNILAAGTPALILPFSQNREQRLRTKHITALSNIEMLDETNLSPAVIAEKISAMMRTKKQIPKILLDGAIKTNEWLTQWVTSEKTP